MIGNLFFKRLWLKIILWIFLCPGFGIAWGFFQFRSIFPKKTHELRNLGACRKRASCSFCDKLITIGNAVNMESFMKSCCKDKFPVYLLFNIQINTFLLTDGSRDAGGGHHFIRCSNAHGMMWPLGKILQFLVVTVLALIDGFAFCCQSEKEAACLHSHRETWRYK